MRFFETLSEALRRIAGKDAKFEMRREDVADVRKPLPPRKPMATPLQFYESMVDFYGEPGENQTSIALPYPMRIAWDTQTSIKRMTCHRKCAEAFQGIFEDTLAAYGAEEIARLRLDLFGGCLNVRKMRGGNGWSIHSWGAAIDIDPDNNQMSWRSSRAALAKPEYERWWDIVEAAGGVSLGRERDMDWMHFQFARLK
jgi:hypothetical protein